MWGFLKIYVQCFSLKLYLIWVCKGAIPRYRELRQLSEFFLSILLINDWKSSQWADEITRSGFEDQPGCWFPTINTYFTSCSVEDLPCLATQQISCFRNRNCLQQATSLKGEIRTSSNVKYGSRKEKLSTSFCLRSRQSNLIWGTVYWKGRVLESNLNLLASCV